jgi:hypothetical protein
MWGMEWIQLAPGEIRRLAPLNTEMNLLVLGNYFSSEWGGGLTVKQIILLPDKEGDVAKLCDWTRQFPPGPCNGTR